MFMFTLTLSILIQQRKNGDKRLTGNPVEGRTVPVYKDLGVKVQTSLLQPLGIRDSMRALVSNF